MSLYVKYRKVRLSRKQIRAIIHRPTYSLCLIGIDAFDLRALLCLHVSEQRLSDVKYREDELNRSLEANKIETEAVVEMRARVDKMTEALQELLHISQQCLVKRFKRCSCLVLKQSYSYTDVMSTTEYSCCTHYIRTISLFQHEAKIYVGNFDIIS